MQVRVHFNIKKYSCIFLAKFNFEPSAQIAQYDFTCQSKGHAYCTLGVLAELADF